jgi:hypothetical protein
MSRVMSMGMYAPAEAERTIEIDEQSTEIRTLRPVGGWNPENFAREQIRGLVRQIFFCNPASAVRQVVLSPIDEGTDARRICRRIGEVLALETASSIAVAGEYARVYTTAACPREKESATTTLRQTATRMRSNLWLVPLDRGIDDSFSSASLRSLMAGLRQEFEYSIVESGAAGSSNEATAMAQLADGIVLVLSAHRTRRATALHVKERLESAHARILGTVLSDRVFPIPEKIYRRL